MTVFVQDIHVYTLQDKSPILRSFIFFVLLITAVSPSWAQSTFNMRGQVKDAATGKTMPHVSVHLNGRKGVRTDGTGSFRFPDMKEGTYRITFSYVGYRTQSQECVLPKDTLLPPVLLEPVASELQTVIVKGLQKELAEAKAVKRSVMPVTIITAREIENRAGNLNDLLARQAGVQLRQSGGLGSDSRVSVRGLEGKRVQVFIDGHPLNTPDGSFSINDLPVQVIERIEIYKGAVPAWLGGDGLGSAINVVLRHRDMSYLDASVAHQSFHTFQGSIIGKKTFEKQGIELGGGVGHTSAGNNYSFESPYQPGLIIKRDHDHYLSQFAAATLRFHKFWFDEVETEFVYLNNRKQIQGIQQNIQSAESASRAGVAALSITKEQFAKGKLGLRYSLIWLGFNNRLTDTSSFMYDWDGRKRPSLYGRGELGHGPKLSNTWQNEWRHRFNLQYTLSENFSLNLNNTARLAYFNPSDTVGNNAAGRNLYDYPGKLFNSVTGLTAEYKALQQRLLMSAAVKHYLNKVEGYNTNIYLVAPADKVEVSTQTIGYNAGLRYDLNTAWLVKASFERAARLPLPGELFGDGMLITPAVKLRPEIANNFSAGFRYDKVDRKDRRMQLEGNVFYMKVKDMIQLAGSGLSTGYVNYAEVSIAGADVEIRSDVTAHLFVKANATYQRLTDEMRYIPATEQVPNPTYKLQIPNVPSFFTNWNVEWHQDGWTGPRSSTRLIYEGTYVDRFYYGFNISSYDNLVIPAYHTHNIAIEQSFQDKRYNITAEVQNIGNAAILNNYNMPLPGRSYRIKLRYLLLGKKIQNHHAL